MWDKKQRSILFLAGDVSGDIYAAKLASLLLERHPDWSLHALGGPHLAEAVKKSQGGVLIGDTSDLSAIGLVAVLRLGPRGLFLGLRMRRFVKRSAIDAVVLCDWGGFNCAHLEFFKKRKIPVLYYFPPRSWQRTGMAGLGIAGLVDRAATPFEWSARRLVTAGCDAEWVGHPLVETSDGAPDRAHLRAEFGLEPSEKLVAILPGSRPPELRILAPRLVAAAKLIRERSAARFVVAVPQPLVSLARAYFPEWVAIVGGRAADVLRACDAAIVKTGTATLEASVAGAPQVAIYDFEWIRRIEWLLLWMWKRIPYIALPNIILQRMAVPELLGIECRPEPIAMAVCEMLENDVLCHRMRSDYDEIRRQLGSGLPVSATQRTAEMVEEMLGIRERELEEDASVSAS